MLCPYDAHTKRFRLKGSGLVLSTSSRHRTQIPFAVPLNSICIISFDFLFNYVPTLFKIEAGMRFYYLKRERILPSPFIKRTTFCQHRPLRRSSRGSRARQRGSRRSARMERSRSAAIFSATRLAGKKTTRGHATLSNSSRRYAKRR